MRNIPLFSLSIALTLPAQAQPPSLTAVVNAASSSPVVAPGSIVTVFGAGLAGSVASVRLAPPEELAGTRVLADGKRALLYYVSPTQVNFVLPEAAKEITVDKHGERSAPFRLRSADQSPGVFTLDGRPDGPAAALHGNGSIVTKDNPAVPGELVRLFLTGLGTGKGSPPHVRIAGVEAPVEFAGGVQGSPGLDEIRFRVPAQSPAGDAVPLVVGAGQVESNRVALAVAPPTSGLLFFATYRYRDNASAVANPYITGALHTVYWSEVEPQEGVYDWSDLDRRIKPWLDGGKKIALRIMWSSSGAWLDPSAKHPTPQWVREKGAAVALAPRTGTEVPLFWDPIYKQYSQRFLREVARRFDGHPHLLFIDVTPGAETNPYRFGMDSSEPEFREIFKKTPASDGRTYSDELWLQTVREYLDQAATLFRKTKLLVTLNVGALEGPSQFEAIGSHAVGRGYYVGQNGLNGRSYQTESTRRTAFLRWDKTTQLYFEMVGRAGGSTGTLMEIMEAAERIGCDFLGVYDSDVLKGTPGQPDFDPAYGEAIRYGAQTIGREPDL